MGGAVTVFLCGDVMTGRGVDQILPHPGDPRLFEPYAGDARAYVELAQAANGEIPSPVNFEWPWGDALSLLDGIAPEVRLINLETSITRSDEFAPHKAVHYRMSPDNLPCLAALRPDVCALANNHVLDFGRRGLQDTLDLLAGAGFRVAGAGCEVRAARAPAIVPAGNGARVIVVSGCVPSSGIPPSWAATPVRAGVNFVPDLSDASATEITDCIGTIKRPDDIAVVSIHWGANWGYEVEPDEIRFAHRLIDGGVDIVHGHSSHHPRPIEIYRHKLVLYGCGDFIDDYEGISGHEKYRDDLRLMYFASIDPATGALVTLQMAAMQPRKMRLRHASREDCRWLQGVLDGISRPFGTHVEMRPDGVLAIQGA